MTAEPRVRARVLVAKPSCDLDLVHAALAGVDAGIEASRELARDDVAGLVVGVEQPVRDRDLESLLSPDEPVPRATNLTLTPHAVWSAGRASKERRWAARAVAAVHGATTAVPIPEVEAA